MDVTSGSFDPDDLFFEHYDDSMRNNDDTLDSDSEDGRHQPVHYVYDAAAERAKERIQQAQAAHVATTLVDSVH